MWGLGVPLLNVKGNGGGRGWTLCLKFYARIASRYDSITLIRTQWSISLCNRRV